MDPLTHFESFFATLTDFHDGILQRHQHGILGWHDHLISNGPMEGTNNKIKTMTRQHYGLRDQKFLKLKLFQLHPTK